MKWLEPSFNRILSDLTELLTTLFVWGIAMAAKLMHQYSTNKRAFSLGIRAANIFVACFIAWLVSEVVPADREWWRTFIIALSAISSDKILDFMVENGWDIVIDKLFKK